MVSFFVISYFSCSFFPPEKKSLWFLVLALSFFQRTLWFGENKIRRRDQIEVRVTNSKKKCALITFFFVHLFHLKGAWSGRADWSTGSRWVMWVVSHVGATVRHSRTWSRNRFIFYFSFQPRFCWDQIWPLWHDMSPRHRQSDAWFFQISASDIDKFISESFFCGNNYSSLAWVVTLLI